MDNSLFQPAHPIKAEEQIGDRLNVLTLSENDETLCKIIDSYDANAKAYYTDIALKDRQDRNFATLFARSDRKFTDINKKRIYSDNILYEIEASLKPLAMSKDPDILIYPGQETEQSQDTADKLTAVFQQVLNTRQLKEVKGIAFKHLPVYFIGAVKYRWNPELGKNGDFEFIVVNPQKLVLDPTAKGRSVENMNFVIEYLDVSIQELIMRFPNKAEKLLDLLVQSKKIKPTDRDNQAALATTVTISEVWFNYYEKKEQGWTKISAVLWKYGSLVFDKMKNPNWDWQGETNYFSYDQKLDSQAVWHSMETEQPIDGFREDKVYHNYFQNPEFPYIFIGYDQWNNMPYDETSRIEQLVRLQENIDDRGTQIKRMLDRAMGKHVFSTEANLKAEDIEEMQWENMDQAIIVDGDVRSSHALIAANQPSPQMFQNYGESRQIAFQKSGVNAITGAIQSNTATSNQIAREANFTRADDLVDATINYLSEHMARAIMQLVKLRYTEEHLIRVIGSQGKVVFERLHRDMIDDGMEVTITASGTDKIQAQNRAMDMAKLQLIDPLNFYKDLGVKNAIERTRMLLSFLTDPPTYLSEFVNGTGGTPEEMGQALTGQGGSGQQATLDIAQITQGQLPGIPQQVDDEYMGVIAAFLQSPEFQQLPPDFQPQVLDWAAQVQAMAEQSQQQGMQPAQKFGQSQGGGGMPANVGGPSPENTGNIPIQPPQLPDGSVRG